jgi:hypothetical protein
MWTLPLKASHLSLGCAQQGAIEAFKQPLSCMSANAATFT